MGIAGISVWQLLIILAIAILLFGGKRITGFIGDLGGAIGGFKRGLTDLSEQEKIDNAKDWEKDS